MKRLLSPVVLVLIGAVVYLFIQVDKLQGLVTGSPEGQHDKDHVELAEYMARIHGYAIKLWAAGAARNQELAEFYRHELEEVMEELDGHRVFDDGVDISAKLQVHGFPMLEALKVPIEARDAEGFAAGYADLLNNCNACHAVSGYPQIRVTVPTEMPQGQDFAPMMR